MRLVAGRMIHRRLIITVAVVIGDIAARDPAHDSTPVDLIPAPVLGIDGEGGAARDRADGVVAGAGTLAHVDIAGAPAGRGQAGGGGCKGNDGGGGKGFENGLSPDRVVGLKCCIVVSMCPLCPVSPAAAVPWGTGSKGCAVWNGFSALPDVGQSSAVPFFGVFFDVWLGVRTAR